MPAPSSPSASDLAASPLPAIRAQRLGRDFGATTAVADVDLQIERGEIYGLLGPNGAGKSTIVRMLCTLLAPTRGVATVAGHDVADDPGQVRLRIGAALQEAALDPSQTGREQLHLQGRLYGLHRQTLRARMAEVVDLVGIGEALDDRVATYSGGMARRLDLACGLIHRPEVLFLDEPTTGLDPISRNRVWEEVGGLNAGGTTVLLTTQYLEEADALADRIGVIAQGRLVAEGTPDELKAQVQPHVGDRPATLDDVFLHVVGTMTGPSTGTSSSPSTPTTTTTTETAA